MSEAATADQAQPAGGVFDLTNYALQRANRAFNSGVTEAVELAKSVSALALAIRMLEEQQNAAMCELTASLNAANVEIAGLRA